MDYLDKIKDLNNAKKLSIDAEITSRSLLRT